MSLEEAPQVLAKRLPASWFVIGKKPIPFPIEDLEETGGNRIVGHARDGRDGEKQDDTGAEPRVWTIKTTIFADMREEGIYYDQPYPGIVDELIASFSVHETGNLFLPTINKTVRVRAHKYQRREVAGEPDSAGLLLVFVEDNEDGVTEASFAEPTARSIADRMADVASFEAIMVGAYSEDIENLPALGEALTSTAIANTSIDIELAAEELLDATRRIEQTFGHGRASAGDVGDLLADTSGVVAIRAIRDLRDVAARATGDGRSRRLVPYRIKTATSIIGIALELGLEVSDLLKENPSLSNPFSLEAGTTIKVYE